MSPWQVIFGLCFTILISLTVVSGFPSHGRRVVCYMASWGLSLAGLGNFDIPDSEKALPMCTHIVYLFANLHQDNLTIIPLDPDRDINQGGYGKTVALKKKSPRLKVMVGLGGWVDGSPKYSRMAKDAQSRATFLESALEFIDKNKLDGLDLNWQFPGLRGGAPEDKANLVLLTKELRSAFDKKGLILSVAVSSFKDRIDAGIDIKGLGEHAHFLNVLSYEYHTTWDSKVGSTAPLYASDNVSINDTINRYLDGGAPAFKLNVGLSLYGVDFILSNPGITDFIGQVTTGHGFKGAFNNVDGFMAYNELCYEKQGGGWSETWDDVSKTPYARNGARIVSVDNARSLTEKIKYAMEKQLGGVIFYGLEKDDFKGICPASKGPYPMLRSIDDALVQYSIFDYSDIRILCKTHLAKFFWNGLKN